MHIWRSEVLTLGQSAWKDHGCDLDSGFGQLPSALRSVLIDAQSLTQLRSRRAVNGGNHINCCDFTQQSPFRDFSIARQLQLYKSEIELKLSSCNTMNI